jgi:hypothetical protein
MTQSHAPFTFALLVACITLSTEPRAAGKIGHVAVIAQPSAGLMLRANPSAGWEPVTAEAKILPGGALKTGVQAASITLTDGTVLEMQPAANVQFHASTEINLDPGPTTRVARVDIKDGLVRVSIPAGGRPLLAMASKDIFVAFRPGKGSARVTSDGLVAVVDSGGAKVAAAGKWTALASGHYQLLRSRGAQEGPKVLPPTPSFETEACHVSASQPCAIGLVAGDGRAPLRVRWKPLAAGYRLVVAIMRDRQDGEVIKTQELSGEATSFQTDPLTVGAYWMGLHAVSPEGIEGTRAVRALNVVRLLPDLGVTWLPNQQVLVFPPGRKVRLDGAQGVQMAWVPPDYVPLPSVLEMTGDFNRTVRMRVEGDVSDDAVITMERSGLRADVEMTPSTARWPKDTVHIKVKVADPRRRIDPRSIHPRLRVKINEGSLQVGLSKVGDSWQGEIAPRSGKGPWAIRVEALDADDNVLGRGLLNVVGRESKSNSLW